MQKDFPSTTTPCRFPVAGQNGLVEIAGDGEVRRIATPPMANRGLFHVGFGPDFVAISEDGTPRRNAPLRLILIPRNP